MVKRGLKVLVVAGAVLLMLAPLVSFRALASTETPRMRTTPLAISHPLSGLLANRFSWSTAGEPGTLLVVGSALIGLGSWMRRATDRRDSSRDA